MDCFFPFLHQNLLPCLQHHFQLKYSSYPICIKDRKDYFEMMEIVSSKQEHILNTQMNEKKAKLKKLLISEKKGKNYESLATEKERMNKKKISW